MQLLLALLGAGEGIEQAVDLLQAVLGLLGQTGQHLRVVTHDLEGHLLAAVVPPHLAVLLDLQLDAGNLGQDLAQPVAHLVDVGRVGVALVEVDARHGPAVAPEAVDGAGHQLVTVRLERRLHAVDQLLLALQAHLFARIVVQLHEQLGLAGVEVLVHLDERIDGRGDDHQADQRRQPAVAQIVAEQNQVVLFEPDHRAPAGLRPGFDEPGCGQRDQGLADEQRGQQRQADGDAQLLQVEVHLAGLVENDRDEDNHRGQGGRGNGQRDLLGPQPGRFLLVLPLLLVAEDVLHHHHRVVHEHADAHDQAEQRQGVEGVAASPDDAARDDQGERDAKDGHQGCRDPSQKQVKDQGGQHGPEDAGEGQIAQGALDFVSLAEPDQEVDALQLRIAVHGGDARLQGVADLHRVRLGFLAHGDADGEVAVQVPPVLQGRFLVDHVGHVAQLEAVGPDGEGPDLLHAGEAAHCAQRVAGASLGDLAQRHIEVTGAQGGGHVADIQSVELQVGHPQVDAHLARVDPVQPHLGHAGNPLQRLDDAPLEQVVARAQIAPRAEPPLEDRHVRVA